MTLTSASAGRATRQRRTRLTRAHAADEFVLTTVTLPPVEYAAIRPSTAWQPASVFLAEAGCMAVLVVIVGFLLAHPGGVRLLPYGIGLSVALVIAFLGPAAAVRSTPPASSGLLRSPDRPQICGSISSRRSWERFSGSRSTACSFGDHPQKE
jgi:hypothetical protein